MIKVFQTKQFRFSVIFNDVVVTRYRILTEYGADTITKQIVCLFCIDTYQRE